MILTYTNEEAIEILKSVLTSDYWQFMEDNESLEIIILGKGEKPNVPNKTKLDDLLDKTEYVFKNAENDKSFTARLKDLSQVCKNNPQWFKPTDNKSLREVALGDKQTCKSWYLASIKNYDEPTPVLTAPE